MSRLGQKQTLVKVRLMSALPPKADIETGLVISFDAATLATWRCSPQSFALLSRLNSNFIRVVERYELAMVAGRLQHSWGQDQNTLLINHLGVNTLNQQCLPASRMVARNHKPFFFGPNIDLVTHPDAPEITPPR